MISAAEHLAAAWGVASEWGGDGTGPNEARTLLITVFGGGPAGLLRWLYLGVHARNLSVAEIDTPYIVSGQASVKGM